MKTRRLFAGAAALAVALILSGCSPLVSFVTSITNAAAGATIVPVVGDCWHADFDAIDSESSWANGRPVGCSQSHQSYTFAVETLREKFTGSSIDPATGFGAG